MPLFPSAHAASLLRRDDAARTVFFPVDEDKSWYVVPDVQTEQRIYRQLKRIRFVQLAAWVLLPALLIGALVITDSSGVLIPKWLFISGFMITLLAIQLFPEFAQRRLARGLALAHEQAPKPSLFEKLPAWVVVLLVAMAVGVAFYLGRVWPLKAIAWLEGLPYVLHESKTLVKVALLIGGAGAMLWGGIGAPKKWFQSSSNQADATGTDEKK
jgi:hypothetical protein